MSRVQSIIVGPGDADQRLDRWLKRLFPHLAQGRIEKMCRKGELRIDGGRIRADWLHNWSFGKWALAGKLLGETTPYIIPWIVAAVHGTAVTGVLAICVTLVGFSNLFVSGLSNYLTPRAATAYAQAGSEELLRVLRKFALLFVAALSALCLLYFTLGETLAVFVYGDAYAGVPMMTPVAVT